MQIVMMGTGPFAVPAIEALVKSRHEVLLLVTRPVTDSGKRRKSPPNPMRDAALRLDLEIESPDNANDPEFIQRLKKRNADLLVVCDFGQILSKECLAATRKGGINLHGSLLPKYRGAAPINWAIYHGEVESGVTVIHMSPKLDAGPCLEKKSTPIGIDEDAIQLESRLSELGIQPVLDAIDLLESWDGKSEIGEYQDNKQSTKARRLRKNDGNIDWNRTAQEIRNQVRAFQPWPGSFSNWKRSESQPLRLIIHSVGVVETADRRPPGTVVVCDKTQLQIACGKDNLSLLEVQVSGKKRMPIAEVLRGYPIRAGDEFASA